MTQDQANTLKISDRVQIHRKGRPSPNLGTVVQIASEIRIQWDSYIWNGEQDGDERTSYAPGQMSRIDRA